MGSILTQLKPQLQQTSASSKLQKLLATQDPRAQETILPSMKTLKQYKLDHDQSSSIAQAQHHRRLPSCPVNQNFEPKNPELKNSEPRNQKDRFLLSRSSELRVESELMLRTDKRWSVEQRNSEARKSETMGTQRLNTDAKKSSNLNV